MDKSIQNISFYDLVVNYLRYLKRLRNFAKISTFLAYRRIYLNYIHVITCVFNEKYPINAVLRNGNMVTLRNYLEVQVFDGRLKKFECDVPNDLVTLAKGTFGNENIITIYEGVSNGDMKAIFVDGVYQKLPVKNKTVVDIGANIADSAIYFALCGATKIIGLEPSPRNYEVAYKNINSNNLNNIRLILAGCSNHTGEIKIDVDSYYESGILFTVKDLERGVKVSLLTLEDILNENNLGFDGSIILKMDCEGCEYESILSANKSTLQRFSHILIEYHHGYKDLKEKLRRSGFRVSVTRPKLNSRLHELDGRKLKFAVGYIYAERI